MAHLVLSAGWTFAALAFCVGLARKSRVEAVILAPVSLIAAVAAYYVTKLKQGQFLEAVDLADPSQGAQENWASFVSKLVGWCVPAVILGLMLGLAGYLAQNHGLRGLPFRIVIPFVAIVETTMRLRAEASLQGELASATWTVTRLLAVAVIIVLVGRATIPFWHRPSASRQRKQRSRA